MIYSGSASFFGMGLEGGHVPTFWLLLYIMGSPDQARLSIP